MHSRQTSIDGVIINCIGVIKISSILVPCTNFLYRICTTYVAHFAMRVQRSQHTRSIRQNVGKPAHRENAPIAEVVVIVYAWHTHIRMHTTLFNYMRTRGRTRLLEAHTRHTRRDRVLCGDGEEDRDRLCSLSWFLPCGAIMGLVLPQFCTVCSHTHKGRRRCSRAPETGIVTRAFARQCRYTSSKESV